MNDSKGVAFYASGDIATVRTRTRFSDSSTNTEACAAKAVRDDVQRGGRALSGARPFGIRFGERELGGRGAILAPF